MKFELLDYLVYDNFHSSYGLNIHNCPNEIKMFLKFAVLCNLTESIFYQSKNSARPFLQGDSEEWIYIEFWTNKNDDILNYILFLQNYIDSLKYLEFLF